MKKQPARKDTFRKILHYIGKYWFFVVLSILFAAVTVALTLYIPILTGKAVDFIIGPGHVDFDGVFGVLRTAVIVIALTAVSQWIMNVCNNRITYHVVQDIRRDAFAKLEILPLKYIDSHSYGDIVSRVVADVDQFADGLLMGFTQLFTGVITILGTLGFMLLVNLQITLVVVLITPVSLFVASFIAKTNLFHVQAPVRDKRRADGAHRGDAIGNQKVVQAFSP